MPERAVLCVCVVNLDYVSAFGFSPVTLETGLSEHIRASLALNKSSLNIRYSSQKS